MSTNPYRATPDIALNADHTTGVVYLIGGTQQVVGGTSIVAPMMVDIRHLSIQQY